MAEMMETMAASMAGTVGTAGAVGTTGAEANASKNASGSSGSEAVGKPSFDELLQDKGHQAEFDRRVSKALETHRAKWEQDTAGRIEAARTEAEKLARMTAEQRAEHERKSHEDGMARREAELTRRELRAQAADTLIERGLPRGLLDTLDYGDAERCKASMDSVETAFRQAVEAGVTERLRGSAPKAPAGKADAHMLDMRKAMGLTT